MAVVDPSLAIDLTAFLNHVKISFPVAYDPVSWSLEQYMYPSKPYKLKQAVLYCQFPLLCRPDLVALLRKLTGIKTRIRISSCSWRDYIVDYAKDAYGPKAELAVFTLIDMSLHMGMDASHRALHRKNLLRKMQGDERLADEIELGICHWTGQKSLPKPWTELLAINGFCLADEEARPSPSYVARRRLLPDTSPLTTQRYSPYHRQIELPVKKNDTKTISWSFSNANRYSNLWKGLMPLGWRI